MFNDTTGKMFNDTTGKMFNDTTGKMFNDTTGKMFNDTTGKMFNDTTGSKRVKLHKNRKYAGWKSGYNYEAEQHKMSKIRSLSSIISNRLLDSGSLIDYNNTGKDNDGSSSSSVAGGDLVAHPDQDGGHSELEQGAVNGRQPRSIPRPWAADDSSALIDMSSRQVKRSSSAPVRLATEKRSETLLSQEKYDVTARITTEQVAATIAGIYIGTGSTPSDQPPPLPPSPPTTPTGSKFNKVSVTGTQNRPATSGSTNKSAKSFSPNRPARFLNSVWEIRLLLSLEAIAGDLHRTLPRLGVFRRQQTNTTADSKGAATTTAAVTNGMGSGSIAVSGSNTRIGVT
eukprot:Lankesteria_metandrocarpae@DN3024_c1_g1_i1.p1